MPHALPDDLAFLDPDERPVLFSSFRDRPLLLIFLRHVACVACRGHLVEVETLRDYLERRGVPVLVVSFTPPKLLKAFLAENPLPFPIVSDPTRRAYQAFELRRASYLSFFRPRVTWKFITQMWSGVRLRKPIDEDVLQLGGDFLFTAGGQLVWSWPSSHAQDRPTPAEIQTAIEHWIPPAG